jgi:hypothetical protein
VELEKKPHFQLLAPNSFGFICFLFGFSFSSRSDDVCMSDKDFDQTSGAAATNSLPKTA